MQYSKARLCRAFLFARGAHGTRDASNEPIRAGLDDPLGILKTAWPSHDGPQGTPSAARSVRAARSARPFWHAVALLLAAMSAPMTHAAAPGPAVLHGIAQVRDGDSLDLAGQRVRLWGVDAPEFKQTCTRAGSRWSCGRDARGALATHLAGRSLTCVPVDRDAYGRVVARCTVGGRSVNEWLVRKGWAVDYTRYSGGRYARAQAEAQAARRGIWSGRFQMPEHYRHSRPR